MSPLRIALNIFAGLLVVAAVILAVCGALGPAIAFGIWAVLLLVGIIFERWRYKPIADAPLGPDWNPTDERFIDPETGKPVTVYFNAATGERRYVNR